MLSVQEGIRYEQNYIKTRPMLKKSSDTLFFFFTRKIQSLFIDSVLKKQYHTQQTEE